MGRKVIRISGYLSTSLRAGAARPVDVRLRGDAGADGRLCPAGRRRRGVELLLRRHGLDGVDALRPAGSRQFSSR